MGAEAMISAAVSPVDVEPEANAELSLAEALALALQIHRNGHLDDARKLYGRVLEASPEHPDALHFLGVLKHQGGDSDAAIELIRRAIDALPGEPGPWNNLGNVFAESGRIDEAMQAYGRCLELAPDFADTHNNLGTIHRLRSEWAEAEASYQRAIAARPDFADAYNNLSKLMMAQRRIREAVLYACKTITLAPHDPEASRLLGFAYYTLGEIDKAADVFRGWLAKDPTHPVALHHLAACTGQDVPARASDAYVERTFDAFAASFDAKLELLDYRAPQLIAAALREACGAPAGALDVLDAGCGTGLCGPLVREYAKEMIGIDLSERMLDKARHRGVYDRLERAELAGYLEAQSERFDVIISADTLCYFGELEVVARAAHGALRTGGTLLFTVEVLPDDSDADYRLQANGRYAHAGAYVTSCLQRAGLRQFSIVPETLRREGGMPVAGWLVGARKPA